MSINMSDFDMISPISAAASVYNDLQIPNIMRPVMLISRSVSFGLFILFFFAESLRLQIKAAEYAIGGSSEKPAIKNFLFRSFVLFFCMAFLYKWTFLKIISICDHIAMLFSDDGEWLTILKTMTINGNVSVSFFYATVPTFVGAIALTALQYVQIIFLTIRFVILALLYCIGPIIWALSISELGSGPLRGWFKNTVKVAFWAIMFSVVKSAITPLVANALAHNPLAAAVIGIIYSIVILAAIYMIPALTDAVFSEANIGAVAGAAMAITSYSTLRRAASMGESAHAGLAGEGRLKNLAEAKAAYKEGSAAGGWKGGASSVFKGMKGSSNSAESASSDKGRTR